MPATPEDIALYTSDGVVISTDAAAGASIKAAHPDAQDLNSGEIEMFFDLASDAQVLLNERFAILSQVHPVHVGIEVEDALALGSAIPLTPAVPCFTLIDASTGLNALARTRAYGHDMGTDRFSIELMK